jgi:hypothetical protein
LNRDCTSTLVHSAYTSTLEHSAVQDYKGGRGAPNVGQPEPRRLGHGEMLPPKGSVRHSVSQSGWEGRPGHGLPEGSVSQGGREEGRGEGLPPERSGSVRQSVREGRGAYRPSRTPRRPPFPLLSSPLPLRSSPSPLPVLLSLSSPFLSSPLPLTLHSSPLRPSPLLSSPSPSFALLAVADTAKCRRSASRGDTHTNTALIGRI